MLRLKNTAHNAQSLRRVGFKGESSSAISSSSSSGMSSSSSTGMSSSSSSGMSSSVQSLCHLLLLKDNSEGVELKTTVVNFTPIDLSHCEKEVCLSLSANSLPAAVSIVDYVEEAAGNGWELTKTECEKTFAIVQGNQLKESIAKEAFDKLTSELQVKVAQVYNKMSETAPKSGDMRFILISSTRGVAESIFKKEPIPEGIASMSCVFGPLASLVGRNGEVGDTHHYRAISKQELEKFLGDKRSKSNLLRLSPLSWADAEEEASEDISVSSEEEASEIISVASKTSDHPFPMRRKLINAIFGKSEDKLTFQESARFKLAYKVAKYFYETFEKVILKKKISPNGNPYLEVVGFEGFYNLISNMKDFMRDNKISWKKGDSNDLSLNYFWKNMLEEESSSSFQRGSDPVWEGRRRVEERARVAELEKYIEELQGQERARVEMLEKEVEKANASQRRIIAEYEAQLLASERQNRQQVEYQQFPQVSQMQFPQVSHMQFPQVSHMQFPQVSHMQFPQVSQMQFPQVSQMQFPQVSQMQEEPVVQEQIVQEQIVQEHIVQEQIVQEQIVQEQTVQEQTVQEKAVKLQVPKGGVEETWKMIAVAFAALLLGMILNKVL